MHPTVTDTHRMTRARTTLVLDSPWFGSLALRLQLVSDSSVKTMCTNGSKLRYSPEWIATLTDAELVGVVAHEVMHCALLHPFRIGARNLKRWNIACDAAINPLLLAQGFRLPDHPTPDPAHDGLSAEQIYQLLPVNEEEGGESGDQDGDGDGDNRTEFEPAPGDDQRPDGESGDAEHETMSETDWEIAAAQATMVARKAGKMSAEVERAASEARQSRTDWHTRMRRFVEHIIPSDYSWTAPNRRYIANGVYLPGLVKENMPRLGVVIDTSGSINQSLLDVFVSELSAIIRETRPTAVDALSVDAEVRNVEVFEPDDEIILHPVGGGGTLFQPAFDWFNEQDEQPAAVIYLTDLWNGDYELHEPSYPVLWCTLGPVVRQPAFGEVVIIDPAE